MASGYRGDRKRKIRILPLRGIPEVTPPWGRDIRPRPLQCSSWCLSWTVLNGQSGFAIADNEAAGRPAAWQGLRQRSALYALAVALVAIAFILRSLLAPTLGDQALY